MKAYLINMHLLVPRSRSSAKVKVKYKGCISQKNCRFGGIHVSQTHLVLFFNPSPNKPWFLHVCSTSLLKTLWVKEKLLVRNNFSFSHSVFYPLKCWNDAQWTPKGRLFYFSHTLRALGDCSAVVDRSPVSRSL